MSDTDTTANNETPVAGLDSFKPKNIDTVRVERIQKRAAHSVTEYADLAGEYDNAMLGWRKTATSLEMILAIGSILAGAGATLGLFEVDITGDLVDVLVQAAPQMAKIALSIIAAYVAVFQPRGKEAKYAAASDTAATLSSVMAAVSEGDMSSENSEQSSLTAHNCISTVLRVLETASIDNLPPLHMHKKTA